MSQTHSTAAAGTLPAAGLHKTAAKADPAADDSAADQIDRLHVPRHVGFILDGNRRWARSRGLEPMEGHREGYETLKRIGDACFDCGVEYASAYVFSTENWKRDPKEVKYLMDLFMWIFKHELQNFKKRGIRLRHMGSKIRLGKALVRAIRQAEEETKDGTKGTFIFCLNYGGQQEIIDAMKRIVADGIPESEISADLISKYMYIPGVPPVDLIIRTSGEQRLSNFMLWEGAYSELMFTKTHWPDFSAAEFKKMLAEYSNRHRRFGN